jgi:glycosyltransferase involved in cell wall biosynthesis
MKKRIFLNGRFLTQPITGVQRTAIELVQALDQLIDQRIIDRDNYRFNLIYSGIPVNAIQLKHIKIVKRGIFKGNLWEQLELPFYTAGNLLISMCTVAPLLKRKQFVIVHDASFIVNPTFFPLIFRTWYKVAISLLGKTARKIITVSDFSKSELIKHLKINEAKITVIYNAADHILKYDDPGDDFKSKTECYKPYCLAVSSLSANKNFNGLSRAIAKIDFKGYHMLIAGGISTTLQAATPDPLVTYLGYVSNEELKYLYLNASLFVFPSFYEGFGIPPLEAMIAGCPVLSSNTSSMPEVLDNACAWFNPHDDVEMASAIHQLINSPERLEQLKAAGYKQSAKYSWNKSAIQLFELIQTVDN